MIQKGFQISKIEGVVENIFGTTGSSTNKNKDIFKKMARAVLKSNNKSSKNWNERVNMSFDSPGLIDLFLER